MKLLLQKTLPVLSLLFFAMAHGQNLPKIAETYFSSVSAGKYTPAPQQLITTETPEDAFKVLAPYRADSLPKVRLKAYRITSRLGLKNSDNSVFNENVISTLINGLQDDDGGIVRQNLSALSNYPASSFSEENKSLFFNQLSTATQHKDLFAEVAGFLALDDAKPLLLTQSRQGSQTDRWSALLSLSRLGDEPSTNYVLRKVKSFPVNDDLVYDLLPHLSFTRQKVCFDYLFEIINSNQPDCSVADPESTGSIICAYRVMELVAPYVIDFPVSTDESGDLDTDSYENALKACRQWISANKGVYRIDKNIF